MGNTVDCALDYIITNNLKDDLEPSIEVNSTHFQKMIDDANALLSTVSVPRDKTLLASPPTRSLPQDGDTRSIIEAIYNGFDFGALNVGVFGGPGSGKVSLIKGMIEEPRSASRSISEEEGKTAVQFVHPTSQHIRFWYLPDEFGDGQEPSHGYFEERYLNAFDALLILVTGKLRPVDIQLVKEAISINEFGRSTPTAVLRSKIDGALISGIGRVSDDKGWDDEKERISNRVRSALRKQLGDAGLKKIPVFLVSQAGILDVVGKECTKNKKYVVDELLLCEFLAGTFKRNRYECEEEHAEEDEKNIGKNKVAEKYEAEEEGNMWKSEMAEKLGEEEEKNIGKREVEEEYGEED